MKIILTKPWNMTDAGAELDVNPPVAEILIGRGIARTMSTRIPRLQIIGRGRSRKKSAPPESDGSGGDLG